MTLDDYEENEVEAGTEEEATYQAPLNSDYIDKQINMDEVIENIVRELSGELFLPSKGKVIKFREPLMNELGIARIGSILHSYLHKGIILSNLSDAEINHLLRSLMETVITDLFINHDLYGIRKESDMELIIHIVESNVLAALKRARYGETFKGLREVLRTVVQKVIEREKKRGFFGIGGG